MADPPREGGRTSPIGSTKDGSSQPEAATAEALRAGNARPRLEDRFERALSLSRLMVVIPVIVLLLSALASFVYGTDVFLRSVASIVDDPQVTGLASVFSSS